MDTVCYYPNPNPEIDIRFPNNFLINATISDYLKLLRLNKKITIDEMAKELDMEAHEYVNFENKLNYDSIELDKFSKELGEILGVNDFKDWMLFVLTETPNQSFVDSYDPKDVLTEVKVKVPSIVKKYDEDGNVYFQRYTEEQLVQNFRKLEHILGDDRLITYYGRVLNNKDKERILQMIEILLDN
jgi:transcriptional regulator with XRE-family HTH domain